VENKTKETEQIDNKPMPEWFRVPKSNEHYKELMVEVITTGMPSSLAKN
jgi:hypothetical protein